MTEISSGPLDSSGPRATHDRSETASPPLDTGEAAHIVGGRLEGDPDVPIRGVSPIEEAGPDELGFLASRKYLRFLSSTRAGALLMSGELAGAKSGGGAGSGAGVEGGAEGAPDGGRAGGPDTRIIVDDPHQALLTLLLRLHPARPPEAGVHSTAVLGTGVELGANVRIGPYAVLADDVTVGDGVSVGAHVVLGRGSRIGEESVLHPHVVLYPGTVLGTRVTVHSGARIGVDGFGYSTVDGVHRKIPQVGRCVVGDDVEIGANAAVDRGSIGTTRIGAGTKIDNLVHLGHNVRVGEGSVLVAQVGVAGSTRIGSGVMLGGQAGISGHLEIGDGARIGGQAGVIGSVEAGATVSGFPARNHREYLKGMAGLMKLPELIKRVRKLEVLVRGSEGRREGR